jgi:hypothetical protein
MSEAKSEAKSAQKTYRGGCHCGNVRYEVQTDLANVISCNCSICSRVGYVLTFVPPEHFKLLAGEGAQTDYQFNTKNIHHLFCSTCGVRSFGRGTGPGGAAMYAINVRTLDGVDADALPIKKVDGKSR